jgi:hypothetical protein
LVNIAEVIKFFLAQVTYAPELQRWSADEPVPDVYKSGLIKIIFINNIVWKSA